LREVMWSVSLYNLYVGSLTGRPFVDKPVRVDRPNVGPTREPPPCEAEPPPTA
jgi:hypothetical protein